MVARVCFFFQAEDGIRDIGGLEFRRVLFRSDGYTRSAKGKLNTDYRRVKTFYQGSYVNEDLLVRWHAGMSLKDFGSSTFYSPKFDNQFEHTFKTYTAIQAETRRGRVH